MISHYVLNLGGTITLDHSEPLTNAFVTIQDDNGTDQVTNQAATVSSIATNLSSDASVADESIILDTVAGILEGVRLNLSGPNETVTVKSVDVSNSTVNLWQPLMSPHSAPATATGTLVSYAVSAADADAQFANGRAVWLLDGSERAVTAVECTRWPLNFSATTQSVYEKDPEFARYVPSEERINDSLRSAWKAVLWKIGSRGRINTFTAGPEFNDAVAYRYLVELYARYRPDTEQQYETYRELYEEAIGLIMSYLPRDADLDGVIEPEERVSPMNVPVWRS